MPHREARSDPGADVTRAPPRAWTWFLGIAGCALVMRALYLTQAASAPLFDHMIVDARQYSLWAHRIAAGAWLGDEVFYQAPLYPYFMAGVECVAGPGPGPMRAAQAILGALSCGILFLAGRELVSHRVGVVAGVLLALYPPAIFFDGLVQKASIGGLFTVLVIWIVSRVRRSPALAWIAALGIAQGLLMLTREETLLLVPVMLAWIAWTSRGEATRARVLRPAALILGLALVLAPVALRNRVVGGEFVLTTSQAGTNFYIGNNAAARGIYAPLRPGRSNTAFEREDAVELAEIAEGRRLTPSEVSAHWFGESFRWIRAEPSAWIGLLARKALLAVNAYEVADAEDIDYYREYAPILDALSRVLHFGTILPLAAAGIVLLGARRRDLAIVFTLSATLLAGVVSFYVMARYRYPLVPFAILFAAVTVVEVPALVRGRAWIRLGPALVALTVTAVATNWPLAHKPTALAAAHHNAAAALATAGRDAEAAAEYRRALELNPSVPETWSNLGLLLRKEGQLAQAIPCLRKAVELRPDDARFLQRVGTALLDTGDLAGAEPLLRRSTEIFARDPEAWVSLRVLYIATDRWSDALAVSRAAVAANPDDVDLRVPLAWMLAECPRIELRDPAESLRLATRIDADVHGDRFDAADVLSLALAANGRLAEAADAARRAARLARAAGEAQIAAAIEAREQTHRDELRAQRR
jgi:Flp pilus assembly protein TadD